MAKLLRTNIAYQMRRSCRVAVGMAVEACYPSAWLFTSAVFGLIELLLREWCNQKTQALELFGIKYTIKQLVVIVDGNHFSL